MSAELEVLQDVVARLEGAGIAYMLTGSIALSYYAQPRMTRDISTSSCARMLHIGCTNSDAGGVSACRVLKRGS